MNNEDKKDQTSKKEDDNARLQEFLQRSTSNPIDEVIGGMLKSDAKSCKLANTRLSQIEEKENDQKNEK